MSNRLSIHVPFEFRATHWLPVRSDPHDHGFRLMLTIEGPLDLETGFVVDMHKVREIVQPKIDALNAQTLNDHPLLQGAPAPTNLAATYPTCETLVSFFAQSCQDPINSLAPDTRLAAVEMHILNERLDGDKSDNKGMDMEEWGFARIELA